MYKHTQNGKVVVSAELNEKTKTYLLTFDDGKTTSCTSSTFKRWYKKIEDQETGTEEANATDNNIEQTPNDETANDGTPLAEAKKEIAEQTKQKAKTVKPKKSKDSSGISVIEARAMIEKSVKEAGFECVVTDKNEKVVSVLVNGKKNITVYIGGKKCVLGIPKAKVPEGYEADRVRNCPISHSFDIQYNAMDRLVEILSKVEVKEAE